MSANLDEYQHKKQGVALRSTLPPSPIPAHKRKNCLPWSDFVTVYVAHMPRILVFLQRFLLIPQRQQHAHTGYDQKRPEAMSIKMELRDQGGAQANHQAAQHYHAKNFSSPPEQHAVLVFPWNIKV